MQMYRWIGILFVCSDFKLWQCNFWCIIAAMPLRAVCHSTDVHVANCWPCWWVAKSAAKLQWLTSPCWFPIPFTSHSVFASCLSLTCPSFNYPTPPGEVPYSLKKKKQNQQLHRHQNCIPQRFLYSLISLNVIINAIRSGNGAASITIHCVCLLPPGRSGGSQA